MKKYIPEHKVQRMRNLVTKNFGDKTKIQVGYSKIPAIMLKETFGKKVKKLGR